MVFFFLGAFPRQGGLIVDSRTNAATTGDGWQQPATTRDTAAVKLADGCRHVFLDVGSNIGMHVRFLFEPHLYPKAHVARAFFQEKFGPEASRDNRDYCVFSFEPNPGARPRSRLPTPGPRAPSLTPPLPRQIT